MCRKIPFLVCIDLSLIENKPLFPPISDLENATLIQILFVNLSFQAIFGTIICTVGRNYVIRTPFFSEELFNRSVTVMLFLPASLEMFGIRYEHSTVISLIPAILMSLFILSKVSTFL